MQADGYTLDDKRNELDNCGDLQNILIKFNERNNLDLEKADRTQKYFIISRKEIKENDYDLSFNRYKEDKVEEINYEDPLIIIDKLLNSEIGDTQIDSSQDIQGGIVKELLTIRGLLNE